MESWYSILKLHCILVCDTLEARRGSLIVCNASDEIAVDRPVAGRVRVGESSCVDVQSEMSVTLYTFLAIIF